MQKSFIDWHMVAQPLAIGCLLACSGPADELPSNDQQTRRVPSDSAESELKRELERDAEQVEGDAEQVEGDAEQEASLEPMATVVRVINRSDQVRSRHTPCAGTYSIGIRPASIDELPQMPTCSRVECASLGPSDVVAPESSCAVPACAGGRFDLAPGSADVDVAWDGVFWSLTERNCYEPQSFEMGTAMVARICFGVPGESPYDVTSFSCEDRPFAYGASLAELELE